MPGPLVPGRPVNNIRPALPGMPRRGNFRFQGKYAFLTYPQIEDQSLELEDVCALIANHILSRGATLDRRAVSIELHQDGRKHVHAFLQFSTVVDWADARCFDVGGLGHPNIAPVGRRVEDRRRILEYVTKYAVSDSSFEEGCFATAKEKRNAAWEALRDAANEKEFWERTKEIPARDAIVYHSQLTNYAAATKKKEDAFNSQYGEFDWEMPEELINWHDEFLVRFSSTRLAPDVGRGRGRA